VDGLFEKDNYRTYVIGEVVTIDTESFNVISDNGDTVTMFAKERLSTDYLQCVAGVSDCVSVNFSYETGWEYTPGPKEINIRDYSSDVATYLDNYQANLRTMTGDDTLTTDLITLTQLGELGCTISEDYTPSGDEDCYSSPYVDWLINGKWIWTKSARSNDPEMVWIMSYDGYLAQDVSGEWFTGDYYYGNAIYDYNGVRPVVTISKEYLLE
jgi:hypothetical protein